MSISSCELALWLPSAVPSPGLGEAEDEISGRLESSRSALFRRETGGERTAGVVVENFSGRLVLHQRYQVPGEVVESRGFSVAVCWG